MSFRRDSLNRRSFGREATVKIRYQKDNCGVGMVSEIWSTGNFEVGLMKDMFVSDNRKRDSVEQKHWACGQRKFINRIQYR